MNKHTENQVAAMLRRMDAYLYGESSEATAIIKDARELLDVCRAVGIQQEQLIMRYEAQQPSGVPEEPNIDKGCLIVARDAIEFEKCQAHKQGYKQGYQQGRKDAALSHPAAAKDAEGSGEVAKLFCETCEGTGKVHQEHQAGCWVGGEFDCPDCDGKGYVISTIYRTTPPAPAQPAAHPAGGSHEPSRND